MLARHALVLTVAVLAGCPSSSPADGSLEDATLTDGVDHNRPSEFDVPPIFIDAACEAAYRLENEDPGIHVDEDASITYNTNPPSSGEHYPEWAVWGVHNDIVPRGYYVHNEEHGGVVVLYRCDGDCTALRSQLEGFVASLNPDPLCIGTGVARRIVLTEDPLIDTPVAAAAWSYTYHAQCYDPLSLSQFVYARTGHATEDTCAQGTYP